MGTLYRLHEIDQPLPRRASRADHVRGELEMPGWDEFTAARDRFFAGLRATAELHRDAGITTIPPMPLEDATD